MDLLAEPPDAIGRTSTQRSDDTSGARVVLLVVALLLLLPGMIEFGLLVQTTKSLNHVAAQVAEVAAAGATPARMDAQVVSCASGINPMRISCTYLRRSWDQAQERWGPWRMLGAKGAENDAGAAEQIRVRLEYPHKLILGQLSGRLLDASEDHTVVLQATVDTARR